MNKAVKCPVCDGKGVVSSWQYKYPNEKACHGCEGKGWIVIYDAHVKLPDRRRADNG